MESDVSDVSNAVSDNSFDLSDISDFDSQEFELDELNEFEREKILAERHAQNVRRRQLKQLFHSKSRKNEVKTPSESTKKSLVHNHDVIKSHELFGDDHTHRLPSIDENELNNRISQAEILLSPKIFNASRLSRKRLLHMLEHPKKMDYIVGAILKVYVSSSRQIMADKGTFSAEPIASIFPESINKHVLCQIVSLCACNQYKVFEIFGCQHDTADNIMDKFIGSSKYVVQCIIMDDPYSNKLTASLTQVQISLNDICDSPFNESEINKLKEYFVKSYTVETGYNKLKNIIKKLKDFTFTDDDVQTILKNKTNEPSLSSDGYNNRELIREIQACSNELDILSASLRKIGTLANREQEYLRNKFEATTKRKRQLESLLSDRRKNIESQINNKISIDSSPFKTNKVYTYGIGGSISNRKSGMTTPMILSAAISSLNNNSPTLGPDKFNNLPQNKGKSIVDYNINESHELVKSFINTLYNLNDEDNSNQDNFILPSGCITFGEYKNSS